MTVCKKNIVVFGAKEDTITLLKYLQENICIPDLVITLDPSKTKDKYHISGVGDVFKYCKENNIKVIGVGDYTLKSINLDDYSFDLGICYGWQRIIPQKVLDKFKIGIFGFHASPLGLPFGKGRSPLNWSIIEGRNKVFNHFFKYNSKPDDGLIYSVIKFEINAYDTIDSLNKKSIITAKQQIKELIEDYLNPFININKKLKPQKKYIKETFYPKRTPKDGKIDLNQSTLEIYNLIRAVTKPFPGAFLFKGEEKILIWEAVPFDNILDFEEYKLGEIIDNIDKTPILRTSDSALLIKSYQSNLPLKKHDILN